MIFEFYYVFIALQDHKTIFFYNLVIYSCNSMNKNGSYKTISNNKKPLEDIIFATNMSNIWFQDTQKLHDPNLSIEYVHHMDRFWMKL